MRKTDEMSLQMELGGRNVAISQVSSRATEGSAVISSWRLLRQSPLQLPRKDKLGIMVSDIKQV